MLDGSFESQETRTSHYSLVSFAGLVLLSARSASRDTAQRHGGILPLCQLSKKLLIVPPFYIHSLLLLFAALIPAQTSPNLSVQTFCLSVTLAIWRSVPKVLAKVLGSIYNSFSRPLLACKDAARHSANGRRRSPYSRRDDYSLQLEQLS